MGGADEARIGAELGGDDAHMAIGWHDERMKFFFDGGAEALLLCADCAAEHDDLGIKQEGDGSEAKRDVSYPRIEVLGRACIAAVGALE